jgi:hypothetical protein
LKKDVEIQVILSYYPGDWAALEANFSHYPGNWAALEANIGWLGRLSPGPKFEKKRGLEFAPPNLGLFWG